MTKYEKYGTITDIPSEKDLFNIENYISGLTSFICDCKTPMTISIQGDWGTGKTSIMKQIETRLDSSNIKSVFFNTWQYSQFNFDNDLTIALITELVSFLAELLLYEENSQKLVRKTFELISHIAVGVVSTVVENSTLGYLKLDGLENKIMNKGSQQVNFSGINSITKLNQSFRELVKKVIDVEGVDRIVFFIDDLDRLHPSRAVEVLEVLKLFLESEDCVYVLAIDYSVVVKGIKTKYHGEIDTEKGEYFFEKLIQVPFTVPTHNYDLNNYVIQLLDGLKVFQKGGDAADDMTNVVNVILKSVGTNPRNIKRLLNSFSLLLRVQDLKNDDIDKQKQLLAVLCLQLSYEEVFIFLNRDIDNLDERFDSLKGDSKLFAQGEIDKPESFDSFMDEFKNIFDGDNKISELQSTLKISESVSSVGKLEDDTTQYVDFWKGFSDYIGKQENFNFIHSGKKVTSRFYRVINKESSDLHCEFKANKNSIGLVYGDIKDKSINQKLKDSKKKFEEKFSNNEVTIRNWKDGSDKNNYNHIPGITIVTSELGLGKNKDYKLIYEWFYHTLREISKEIDKLKEQKQHDQPLLSPRNGEHLD